MNMKGELTVSEQHAVPQLQFNKPQKCASECWGRVASYKAKMFCLEALSDYNWSWLIKVLLLKPIPGTISLLMLLTWICFKDENKIEGSPVKDSHKTTDSQGKNIQILKNAKSIFNIAHITLSIICNTGPSSRKLNIKICTMRDEGGGKEDIWTWISLVNELNCFNNWKHNFSNTYSDN